MYKPYRGGVDGKYTTKVEDRMFAIYTASVWFIQYILWRRYGLLRCQLSISALIAITFSENHTCSKVAGYGYGIGTLQERGLEPSSHAYSPPTQPRYGLYKIRAAFDVNLAFARL